MWMMSNLVKTIAAVVFLGAVGAGVYFLLLDDPRSALFGTWERQYEKAPRTGFGQQDASTELFTETVEFLSDGTLIYSDTGKRLGQASGDYAIVDGGRVRLTLRSLVEISQVCIYAIDGDELRFADCALDNDRSAFRRRQ